MLERLPNAPLGQTASALLLPHYATRNIAARVARDVVEADARSTARNVQDYFFTLWEGPETRVCRSRTEGLDRRAVSGGLCPFDPPRTRILETSRSRATAFLLGVIIQVNPRLAQGCPFLAPC